MCALHALYSEKIVKWRNALYKSALLLLLQYSKKQYQLYKTTREQCFYGCRNHSKKKKRRNAQAHIKSPRSDHELNILFRGLHSVKVPGAAILDDIDFVSANYSIAKHAPRNMYVHIYFPHPQKLHAWTQAHMRTRTLDKEEWPNRTSEEHTSKYDQGIIINIRYR